ncbi:MAG: arabinofuranosyltransferase [Myxococcota bacterium]|jgi:arabinofuranosyltransferase
MVGLTAAAVGARLWRGRHPDLAIDDAWISFRIARTMLEGGGLTFNAGEPPVEGMTNLLWTLLSATWIAAAPTLDPIGPARIIGGLCLIAAAALAASLAARLSERGGGVGWLAAAGTGAAVAASGSLAYHAASGLETGLWGLLFVASLTLAERAHDGSQRAGLGLGVVLGALAATRPEGVLIGLCASAVGLKTCGRRALPGVVTFVVLVGVMELFRLLYYGELVPNTFHAKPPDPAAGLGYARDFWLYGLGGVGVVVYGALWRAAPASRWLSGLCLLLAAGAIWSGGDWMAGHRRFTAVTWAGALLAGIAVGRPDSRLLGLVGLLGLVAGPTVSALRQPDAGRTDTEVLAEIAQRARDSGVRSAALVDIGRFGWVFEGQIYDMVGLTDRHIAHREGGFNEKAWDEEYFRRFGAELVVIRSETPIVDPLPHPPVIGHPDQQVLLSILDGGGYRLRAVASFDAARHLLVFEAEGRPLPEALWGPVPEKGLRQLLVELHE